MKPYPQYGIYHRDRRTAGRQHAISLAADQVAEELQSRDTRSWSVTTITTSRISASTTTLPLYTQQYSWINSPSSRHRLTAAGTWEVPFGKGRTYMTNAPGVLDAVVGGWNLSPVLYLAFRPLRAVRRNGGRRRSAHLEPRPYRMVQHRGVFAAAGIHAAHQSLALFRDSPGPGSSTWMPRWSSRSILSSVSGSSCAWTSSTS